MQALARKLRSAKEEQISHESEDEECPTEAPKPQFPDDSIYVVLKERGSTPSTIHYLSIVLIACVSNDSRNDSYTGEDLFICSATCETIELAIHFQPRLVTSTTWIKQSLRTHTSLGCYWFSRISPHSQIRSKTLRDTGIVQYHTAHIVKRMPSPLTVRFVPIRTLFQPTQVEVLLSIGSCSCRCACISETCMPHGQNRK